MFRDTANVSLSTSQKTKKQLMIEAMAAWIKTQQ